MIKKIIACLTICFIITGIISPVFSYASALPQPNWSDPGISEIINISDLTGWMLNGGTFDVSSYTDAESFMNDYFNARTRTRLVSPGEVEEDYYEVLPGFGINNQLVAGESFARPLDTNRVIASSFRDHTGYGRRLSNEVNDALLSSGSLYDTKIPLLNEVEFANFVGYNHDALRLYSEFFNFTDPNPSPNPDPTYAELVYNICNFPIGGYDNENKTYDGLTVPINTVNHNGNPAFVNRDDYSYVQMTDNTDWNYQSRTYPLIRASNIITLYITEDNGTWTVDGNIDYSPKPFKYNSVWANDARYYVNDNGFYISNTENNQYSVTLPHSSSYLSNLLNWVNIHFRHCNLYVNGELWGLADDPPITPHITPEFPDAVGGEELPNTTWPISRPRAPYYTNVPGILQAIEDAISDDGELDIDDLKPYLTDENGDPVPDPIFDPEPVPIPVPDPVNPDVVPGLPELPAIPLDMPGFNGVSVLAEIINFTNQSLPTSLIITFWGIVFGIVILGLIKILHK